MDSGNDMDSEYHNVFVFSFDVVGYSEYKAHVQTKIQIKIDECLQHAVPERPDFVGYNDEGDGGFVLLQDTNKPEERKSALKCLIKFDSRLDSSSKEFEPPLRMRYALHEGRIVSRKRPLGGTAYAGNAINESRRLVSSMPNSKAGQVLCSLQYHKTLIEEVGLTSDLFYTVPPFSDKHGNMYQSFSYYDGAVGFDWDKYMSFKSEQKKYRETTQESRDIRKQEIQRVRLKRDMLVTGLGIVWFVVVIAAASKFIL